MDTVSNEKIINNIYNQDTSIPLTFFHTHCVRTIVMNAKRLNFNYDATTV